MKEKLLSFLCGELILDEEEYDELCTEIIIDAAFGEHGGELYRLAHEFGFCYYVTERDSFGPVCAKLTYKGKQVAFM